MLANIFKQITLSLSTKMVFVVRTDLKMSTGKIASQCAHAAVILTTSNTDTGMLKLWMLSGQSKVVLKVNSEDKLEDLKQTAVAEGLNVCVVCDAGRTQVESGTATVLGIGPHKVEDVDRITKGLKLL